MKRFSLLFYIIVTLAFFCALFVWDDPMGNTLLVGAHRLKQWAHGIGHFAETWIPSPATDLQALKARVDYLQEENAALRRYVLSTQLTANTAVFPIIGYSPLDSSQILKIKGGKADRAGRVAVGPVTVGQVAVDQNGALLGRVIRVYERTSDVLLITNPDHSVDVRIGKTGARALLSGRFERLEAKRGLWITQSEFIDRRTEVKRGDEVYTSGLDGLYPPNLFVGIVYSVEEDDSHLFHTAIVIPSAELSALQQLVLIQDHSS